MTDLIGMEVRSERTTLIKTGDWSPDLLRGAVPYDGNFNERRSIEPERPQLAKCPHFHSHCIVFHHLYLSTVVHPLCILASGVIADEKFWRGCIYGVINGGRSNK